MPNPIGPSNTGNPPFPETYAVVPPKKYIHHLNVAKASSSLCELKNLETRPTSANPLKSLTCIRPFLWMTFFLIETITKVWDATNLVFQTQNQKICSKAQNHLAKAFEQKDPEIAKDIMWEWVERYPFLAPIGLVDFLSHENCLMHVKEIMCGANIVIKGTSKELFNKLTRIKGANRRPSSHPHKKDTSFGIASPLFGELLFWIDEEGRTRLQFEAHPLTSVYNFFCHTSDFLKYRLTGAQQGPYGSSLYTDLTPLAISWARRDIWSL